MWLSNGKVALDQFPSRNTVTPLWQASDSLQPIMEAPDPSLLLPRQSSVQPCTERATMWTWLGNSGPGDLVTQTGSETVSPCQVFLPYCLQKTTRWTYHPQLKLVNTWNLATTAQIAKVSRKEVKNTLNTEQNYSAVHWFSIDWKFLFFLIFTYYLCSG